MAFLGTTYDSDTMPKNSVVPAGWYTSSIRGVEIKDNKKKDGNYLNIEYQITGPSHAKAVVFGMITLRNVSETAEHLGQIALNNLMSSLGIKKLTDSDQLVGGDVEIRVTVKDDPEYGPKNEVKGWRSINGSAPPMPKPTAQPTLQPQPPKPAAGPSPWNKPKPAAQPAPQPEEDPFA